MLGQMSEDKYFAHISNSKNIECILSIPEITINIRENGLRAKKFCSVYAEKIDFKELIQLRLTEKCDQRRMYITTVDCASFQELKQDQSLHVTFSGFIENLIRMLQDCQNGKLELNLARNDLSENFNIDRQSGNCGYQLQFVEMRPFKNLVHLYLPCRAAPLHVVLFYVNQMLEASNKKANYHEQVSRELKDQLNDQQRHIEHLDAENGKLHDSLIENARVLNESHTEQMKKMEEQLRELREQQNADNQRYKKNIAGLQIQMGKIKQDKNNLLVEKEQDLKHIQTLSEELATMKSRVFTLKEQNENLHADITALKNNERMRDLNFEDARKQLADLQDKIKLSVKEKANLNAELEAEKKILQTKRQALEMATDEISKANQIIFKQNQEIMKLKKTIELRTEVALQQELAIKEREKSLCSRDEEIAHMRETIEALHKEIPMQLSSMRDFACKLEKKYTNEINALKANLNGVGASKENCCNTNGCVRRSCTKRI